MSGEIQRTLLELGKTLIRIYYIRKNILKNRSVFSKKEIRKRRTLPNIVPYTLDFFASRMIKHNASALLGACCQTVFGFQHTQIKVPGLFAKF